MIIPDINLLIYAYNEGAPSHERAKAWWEETVNSGALVGLPWVVVFGFVRLMTHPRVLAHPLAVSDCIEIVSSWLGRRNVQVIDPGPRHFALAADLFAAAGCAADLTTDVHLAAIAIEYRAELHSNDADFARFPGLRTSNPLAPISGAAATRRKKPGA